MENWVNKVVSKWKNAGVKINPGASLDLIESTERILNFKFPGDFKNFYMEMDGFTGLDCQEHLFTFWPLEMIISEFDEREKGFIGFSDYSLKVNAIGFKRGEEGIFKIYPSLETKSPEYIASSFEEVVEMINSDSGLIY